MHAFVSNNWPLWEKTKLLSFVLLSHFFFFFFAFIRTYKSLKVRDGTYTRGRESHFVFFRFSRKNLMKRSFQSYTKYSFRYNVVIFQDNLIDFYESFSHSFTHSISLSFSFLTLKRIYNLRTFSLFFFFFFEII